MSALRTVLLRTAAYFLLFLCWLSAAHWVSDWHDRPVWMFLGVVTGGGALWILHSVRRSRRAQEQAAHVQRQTDVLRLAEAEAGQLTATRVAVALGWPMRTALATLRSLDDGLRVTTLVSAGGVMLYEFPEIVHGGGAAGSASAAEPARGED